MGNTICHVTLAHYSAELPDPAAAEARLSEDAPDAPAVRQLLIVDRPTPLDCSGVPCARWVFVANRTGGSETVFPDDARAAAIAAAVLRVAVTRGVGLPADADYGLRLLPHVPGFRPGTAVALPLGPDSRVWLRPEVGVPVSVSVLIVPGNAQ